MTEDLSAHPAVVPRPAPASAEPASDPFAVLDRSIFAHRGALAAAARREGLSPEDAVDVVQEAFATLLQQVLQGRAPATPSEIRSWLFGVARNLARNGRRLHRNAAPHEPLAADAGSGLQGGPELPAEADTEALVAEAEEHVRLRACVARLCDTQRAVVTMRLLDERAGEDVAERLGISRGYVDVLLHRAKGSLRACMLDHPGAEG